MLALWGDWRAQHVRRFLERPEKCNQVGSLVRSKGFTAEFLRYMVDAEQFIERLSTAVVQKWPTVNDTLQAGRIPQLIAAVVVN